MTSVPPELASRVGALAKNLDMNMDAIALLTRKAEAMRETLQLQSVITAENGVSQRYQERIDELTGQVSCAESEQLKKRTHGRDGAVVLLWGNDIAMCCCSTQLSTY